MPPEQYEVKVTVGDAEIEVRGAEQGVVAIVRALSDILSSRARSTAVVAPAASATAAAPAPRAILDAKTFFSEKSPSTQSEAMAVAAFYLSELAPGETRFGTINKERARDIFRQARFPLPKRIEQVLVNTQNAGYLNRVSAGEYTLSPVGYNLVEHTLGSDA